MGDGRLKDMSAFQLAGITKHTVETARLLEGQSTANIAQVIQMTPETREVMQRNMVKIRRIAGQVRQDGAPSNSG